MATNTRTMDAQKALNRCMPLAKRVSLGDMLNNLINQVNYLTKRLNNRVLSNPGLVIKAGSSPIVKAGSAFLAEVGGVLIRKAANTDMSALAGTLATAKSAAWAFYINSSGTISTSTKTADAATHDAALALLTGTPDGYAQIGVIVIDNATGSNFVGGTTALDVANLTVTYYSANGPMSLASDTLSLQSLSKLSTY